MSFQINIKITHEKEFKTRCLCYGKLYLKQVDPFVFLRRVAYKLYIREKV